MDPELEDLEQYDFFLEEYIHEVDKEYAPLLGLFLIRFSSVEHTLNLVIADIINERNHEPGYSVIERLTTSDKIDLFFKMYLRLAAFRGDSYVAVLKAITDRLKTANSFRNVLVHANWYSLTEDGYVRSKIITDLEQGQIKFRKFKMTQDLIRNKIEEVEQIEPDLDEVTQYIRQA